MGARVYRVNRIVLVNLMYLTIGMSFTISGLLPPTAFVWFAVLSAIEGITSSVFNSSFVSVVQTRIDAGVLGRVMSLYYSFGLLPSAIGLLGTGFLAEQVGLTTTFVIAGLVICTLGLTAFCIPYGKYNKTTLELLREAGYDISFTTDSGRVCTGDELYTLRRIHMVGGTSAERFAKKVAGCGETGEKDCAFPPETL